MSSAKKIHFIGIGGSGMSALSQIAAMEGRAVTGSDRDFDNGGNLVFKTALLKLGIQIFPQDGSGIDEDTSEVAVSTAIEESNPEISKARAVGAKLLHRSELLSHYVDTFRTVAVGGTSGKSTVVGMLFTIFEEAGLGPSVITGGPLVALKERGFIGNAWRGKGDILVIEADESDGTIVKYHPMTGLILNVSKDHKEVADIKAIFRQFAGHVKKLYVNADDPELSDFRSGAGLFGRGDSRFKIEDLRLEMFCSRFKLNGVNFVLPSPGLYNIENALAAIAVALDMGIKPELCAESLKKYRGVQRRFELAGEAGGVTVVDDYAHNPAKISAVLGALHKDSDRRVIAIYQPHGFSPTRHLRRELVDTFLKELKGRDILIMPEIYYAGGTVAKDISSKDLTDEVSARGGTAFYFKQRRDIVARAVELAAPGDVVLVMGARDWTLSDFAKEIFGSIKSKFGARA
ncbi:MAG: Mur ligase domain-containing protein [Elusimicrobiota bacterium]